MNVVDAFLLCSAIAYYLCLFLPKATLKNVGRLSERLGMFACGTLLLINLHFNIYLLWLIMVILWVFLAELTFLGYGQWNVLWRKDVSDTMQATMFCWDLLIAVCCAIKL